jgi:spore germination protein PE
MYRTSIVDEIELNSLISSSVLQTGDTERVHSFSAALAIQRENAIYGAFNLSLSKYSIFSSEIETPTCPPVKVKTTFHARPIIHVGKIDILGISSASILHIGSAKSLNMQSRVKHVRNFLKHPYLQEDET